jgi:hypothetical protein
MKGTAEAWALPARGQGFNDAATTNMIMDAGGAYVAPFAMYATFLLQH